MLRKNRILAITSLLLLLSILSCGRDNEGNKKTPFSMTVAQVGLKAPDFTLKDTAGNTWSLADYRGKVVFINFWATWCPPCREEMPSMERLKNNIPPDKFEMVTILSNDDPILATDFVKRLGGTFPVLDDPDGSVGRSYGLTGVPETYIVDPEGILREKFLGPRVWDSPWGMELVRQYLP